MIGSLSILALCLLTGGMSVSALAISNDHSQVERNNVVEPTDYISNVNGGSYKEYWSRNYTLSNTLTSSRNAGFEVHNYETGTVLPFDFSSDNTTEIVTLSGAQYFYLNEIDLASSSDIAFAYQWYSYNSNNFGLMRIYVPSNSLINAIEIRCNQQYGVRYCNFGTTDIKAILPTYSDGGTKTFQNYFLISSSNSNLSSNDLSVNTTVSVDKASFYEYLFYWYIPDVINALPSFEMHFLNGGDGAGYVSGYADGYNQGLTEGYQNGYGAGIQVAQSGTNFLNLFGAIADTPVMMIRSLFNFDLFGTSALVIIMSLLTGLIVLTIIKKVWK